MMSETALFLLGLAAGVWFGAFAVPLLTGVVTAHIVRARTGYWPDWYVFEVGGVDRLANHRRTRCNAGG
jgi:hypothetical protein